MRIANVLAAEGAAQRPHSSHAEHSASSPPTLAPCGAGHATRRAFFPQHLSLAACLPRRARRHARGRRQLARATSPGQQSGARSLLAHVVALPHQSLAIRRRPGQRDHFRGFLLVAPGVHGSRCRVGSNADGPVQARRARPRRPRAVPIRRAPPVAAQGAGLGLAAAAGRVMPGLSCIHQQSQDRVAEPGVRHRLPQQSRLVFRAYPAQVQHAAQRCFQRSS